MKPSLNAFSISILLLTFASTFIGAWFYAYQLTIMPFALWLFVPDCPLYALLAAPILLFAFPKNAKFRFIVACGLLLYGSWTISVFLLDIPYYFSADRILITAVLIIGHIGMILESFLVLPKQSEMGIGALLVAWGWFLINLHFDYFNGVLSTHPLMPDANLGSVLAFTAIMTLAVPALLFALSRHVEKIAWLCALRKKFLIAT